MLCLQASSSHIAHTRSVVSPSNGRRNVIVRVKASKPSAKSAAQKSVNYGTEWYEQTRNASKPFRTVKEEIGKQYVYIAVQQLDQPADPWKT